MKKKSEYAECLNILQEMKKIQPHATLAQHIHTCLADYGNFWGLSDREFLQLLSNYKEENSLDKHELDIEEIIKDANNLLTPPEEEDEDGY